MSEPGKHPLGVASELATKIFHLISEGRHFPPSPRLIDRGIERAGLSGAHSARVFDVTLGILRWRDRLDNALSKALTKGSFKMPEQAKNLLRAAAYELVVRREDEPAGLVNKVVDISKHIAAPDGRIGKLAPLFNAVLRKIAGSSPEPMPGDDAGLDGFSTFYSIPEAILSKAAEQYDRIWMNKMCRSTGDRFIHHLRVNPFVEPNEAWPEALNAVRFESNGEIIWEADSLSHEIRAANIEGKIIIQSLPSQTAAIMLDPRPGDRVLDAASGVGIKAHHLMSLIAGWGDLVLCDISPEKRKICLSNFTRWNVPEPDYRLVDLADSDAVVRGFEGDRFDAILLDAPCSGSGLIHHLPEKRYTMNLELLGEFQALQKKMLRNCLTSLSPGGRLVYATCSIWAEENECVTDEVLCESEGRFKRSERQVFAPCGRYPGFFIEKILSME